MTEPQSLHDFQEYNESSSAEPAQSPGARIISSRWRLREERRSRRDLWRAGSKTLSATGCVGSYAYQFGASYHSMVSLKKGWVTFTCDFPTAFLHAALPLAAPVYKRPPAEIQRPSVLWRLNKALYGLRRNPQIWQEHLVRVYESMSLVQA